MKKINLSIQNRIILYGLLPKTGSPLFLMTVEDLTNKIKFSQTEINDYEIKDNIKDEKVYTTWNELGLNYIIDIELSQNEIEVINKIIKDLGENFPIELLNIYKQLNTK